MAIIFIEQPIFTQQVVELVEDDDYGAFQRELAQHPEKGEVIPGSGGLRKVRMRLPGRGKRGGARVLYLYFERHHSIVLYFLYTKGDTENIPSSKMKDIKHEIQRIKKSFGEGN